MPWSDNPAPCSSLIRAAVVGARDTGRPMCLPVSDLILAIPSRVRSPIRSRSICANVATTWASNQPVKAQGRRYRCAGHIMRSREQIDAFVVELVRRRLALPDLQNLLPTADEPRMREIKEEINEHRAKILRAQRDYDDETIQGLDLKRIRDRENAAIDTLEVERKSLSRGSSANNVVATKNPVATFDAADLATRRSTIDLLCEVRLYPHPRGVKAFNMDSVGIQWRSATDSK